MYEADKDWSSQIAQASVDKFTFDGQIYAVPWSQDGKVFYYNKKIFEENNVSVPKTYEELKEVIAKLEKNGVTPIVVGTH